MIRWRIDLAYDGTAFHGWAEQPGLRTVQGELERWLPQVLRLDQPVRLTVAGRTDAGVHADAQVCHVDLPDEVDTSSLLHRLRRVLADDIAIRSITAAPEGFDARFSALWRRYRYRIWDDASVRTPTRRHQVAPAKGTLDVAAMQTAADLLRGLRDFAAFCKPRDGATTIRTLRRVAVERDEQGQVDTVLVADAFCHSMVRSVMGALVAIGQHRRGLAWLEEVLTLDRRASDITVMPARGLTLEAVGYPADTDLAERAEQSRRHREPTELVEGAEIEVPDELTDGVRLEDL
ncbi:tRNA pseudouridine(38-40) synthase TruA [Aestuariimicrobium kwangyangense]|uniref:tRNA pseudouridine(38-40) synthase TruA n=1 Tax=Aestuariimicrobium kwangyangense TaxID=396389 RepID=UPI0003B42170|nr:tRNA pseudouridine(38-40) synthase TruA [Aestuariimicrobium kwangyangense]